MDQNLYRTVNRFAARTGWAHPFAIGFAKYGVAIFVGVLILAWWRARSTGDLHSLAGAVWAAVAALIALGIGQIIGGILDRHRPYEAMGSVHVLVSRTTDFSLPSDHATAVGAVAVGLWLSNRPLGKIAVVLAIIMAFTRVYVGAHYPADVLAGLALGGITAGIGAKHGTRLLEATIAYINRLPHASAITGSRT